MFNEKEMKLTQPFSKLQIQAAKRIQTTLKALRNNELHWIENPDANDYEFIDKKYGYQQYEHYKDNQLYGKGALYRHVNQLKPDIPLHILIPHGITPSNIVWSKEIYSGLPIACFSDHSKHTYEVITRKRNIKAKLFSSIHPFLKIAQDELLINGPRKLNQQCIYFPLHSTKATAANMHCTQNNTEKILKGLRSKYKKVNLCIYYIDYQKLKEARQWNTYKANFDTIYCCGSRYEPAFLVNLLAILLKHDTLISEGVGSHILYGRMAGLKIELIEQDQSFNPYSFNDAMQALRKDGKARAQNLECFASFHEAIVRSGKDYSKVIDRYIYYYLSKEEQNVEKQILDERLPESHIAFTEKYEKKLFPLISE